MGKPSESGYWDTSDSTSRAPRALLDNPLFRHAGPARATVLRSRSVPVTAATEPSCATLSLSERAWPGTGPLIPRTIHIRIAAPARWSETAAVRFTCNGRSVAVDTRLAFQLRNAGADLSDARMLNPHDAWFGHDTSGALHCRCRLPVAFATLQLQQVAAQPPRFALRRQTLRPQRRFHPSHASRRQKPLRHPVLHAPSASRSPAAADPTCRGSDCFVADMTGDQLDSGNSCRVATALGRGRERQGGPARPC